MKKILSISPHPDDTEFGLGGFLNRYRGLIEIQVVVLSDREKTRGESNNEAEQYAALDCFGIPKQNIHFIDELPLGLKRFPIRFMDSPEIRDQTRKLVQWVLLEWKPDIIFIPGINETMQDHSAVAEEFCRVGRWGGVLLGYEVPKHNRFFKPNVFFEISDEDLTVKMQSLNCFKQFTNRYYFNEEMVKSLAKVRASDAGSNTLVEAFELYQAFIPLSKNFTSII